MDYPVTPPAPESDAVVVWANHFQFAPGEVITNNQVESRALIWWKAGVGSIDANGDRVEISPSTCAFLPWRHDVTYHADPNDPFMVSAVHLVPWHDPSVEVKLHAAHGRHDRLAGVPHRRDIDWPDLRGVVRLDGDPRGRLLRIGDLTVEQFEEGRPDDAAVRALAILLIGELRAAAGRRRPVVDVPPRLLRMQEYIGGHLNRAIAIGEIAAAGSVSESTVERLFRRHTGHSAGQWIAARRMSVARELLRTTNNSVAQVAAYVGFRDPSYFSRIFRRTHGVSPRTYAMRSRVP
jgi:AraC-like DNA-binding protein